MLVYSYDNSNIGFFDPQTGELREFEPSEVDIDGMTGCGHFVNLDGKVAVFYRSDGDLFLRVLGLTWRAVPSLITWHKEGTDALMTVKNVDGESVLIRYMVEDQIPGDLTPFVEDEHFDFGLFVTNVLNDPGRREGIYR